MTKTKTEPVMVFSVSLGEAPEQVNFGNGLFCKNNIPLQLLEGGGLN